MNGDSSRASDTSPVEVTKKGIRLNVMKQARKFQNVGRAPYYHYNRIPWFSDAEDPVEKLKELDEFKNAENVLVAYDKAQESIRLACLQAGKTLYIQVPKLQRYLMTRLKMDEGTPEKVLLEAMKLQGLEVHGKQIGLEDKVPIDLVIVGSMAVSKDGIRIGKGGGYVDLYLAVLTHLKLIDANTTIITTVHDSQIVENIPSNLVGPHDYPVDIIVTPTQVIRAQQPKPAGIMWNLIYSHQLNPNQILTKIRDQEIQAGKECTLKVVDSDTERDAGNRGQRRLYYRRFTNNRRWQGQRYRKQPNDGQSESEHYEGGEAETGNMNNKIEKGYRRPYPYRRKKPVQQNKGKTSYRDKTWRTLRLNRFSTTPRFPYFRIPGFKGVLEANELFKELEVFKKAKNVLVSSDKLHEGIRLACLEAGKNLYILNPKPLKELIIRLEVPSEENKVELPEVINRLGIEKYGVKLDADESLKMDLWVIGSVAISKDGFHIGKGNGSIDLFYGYLSEKKVITPDTTIVTVVHNSQVFDTLPAQLFNDHDVPVDIIVTPQEVLEIKVERKPPTGIVWNLLSEHQLSRLPYLIDFREKEMQAGKTCVLKEDNSDGDGRKRYPRSNEQSESEHNEGTEGESGNQNRKKRTGPKIWRRGRRNHKETGENDESGNISPDTTSRPRRRYTYRPNKLHIDFSIKLTSIDRAVRVRDLKTALNERNVKPNLITWMGSKGYCYLHFSKTAPPPSVDSETELNSESILSALANLTLNPTTDANEESNNAPQPNKVSIELAKPYPRIETAEETTV